MKTFKLILQIFFVSILLSNCGGKEKEEKESVTYGKSSDSNKKEVKNNVNEITITSNDLMKFNKDLIKVKSGEKVKITLTHIGKLDIKVMGHNFVLLKQGVDIMAFGNKAATFADNDYIPNDSEDIIAHTKLIGAGETAIVEFEAPSPGEYDFICSFPGHYAIMKGKFVVE